MMELPVECIGRIELTLGTETSKYQQEKKSIETPSVAASERGSAQTGIRPGVVDTGSSYKGNDNRSVWKVTRYRVIVP